MPVLARRKWLDLDTVGLDLALSCGVLLKISYLCYVSKDGITRVLSFVLRAMIRGWSTRNNVAIGRSKA